MATTVWSDRYRRESKYLVANNHRLALAGGHNQRASHGICNVILPAGAVVYTVFAAARGPAFKAMKLRNKAAIIE